MPLFRADRAKAAADDPFLLWKVRLFVVGAGLGLGGMAMEIPVLLWLGVAALLAGMILRFREQRLRQAGADPFSDDDGDDIADGADADDPITPGAADREGAAPN